MMFHYVPSSRVLFTATLIACLPLCSCTKTKEPPKERPPAPVEVATVTIRTVPVQLAGIGSVEAYSSVAVKSRVDGTIVKVHFAEGQDVRQGDILFTLDTAPFQAALRHAEAVLARDLAQARNAEEQAARYASLVKEGIVTREQYDSYRTAADALHATVAADRAAVDNARIALSYCTIRAPLTGRTGGLAIHAGNVISSNDTVLVIINQISPIYATFSLPEKDLPEIQRRTSGGKLRVEAAAPSDPDSVEQGAVTFLDNMVDPATGMFKLKATFTNQNRKLWPGQFVNVRLTLATLPDAVVVPQQTVLTGQKGQYVFLHKNDGTVEQRPVQTGISHGGEIVIRQGLQPGETVVIDGQMRLMPGAKAVVRKAAQEDTAAVRSGKPDQNRDKTR
jgi:membrane fusion protein, multidrug efflux system